MKGEMRCSLILLLIVCWASSGAGQPSSSAYPLTGSVQDPSGAGIQGAKLTLKPSDGGDQQTTITDGAGAFRFERATTGAHELRVEKEGFKVNNSRMRIGSRAPESQSSFGSC